VSAARQESGEHRRAARAADGRLDGQNGDVDVQRLPICGRMVCLGALVAAKLGVNKDTCIRHSQAEA